MNRRESTDSERGRETPTPQALVLQKDQQTAGGKLHVLLSPFLDTHDL